MSWGCFIEKGGPLKGGTFGFLLKRAFRLPGEGRDRFHWTLPSHILYAARIGAFLCPEIRAFSGSGGEIPSIVPKAPSDRKVLFKHKTGRSQPLMAVNSC